VTTVEEGSKGYGDCKIFRINKRTGEEYLFKTIKAKDMGEDDNGSCNYNSRNVGADKPFTCKDCKVEGKRRMLTKVRCDACHKKYKRAYQKVYAKKYNEAQRMKKPL
jgi:hypothetical protein